MLSHTSDCILFILCHNINLFTTSRNPKTFWLFTGLKNVRFLMWPQTFGHRCISPSLSLPCLSVIPSCLLSHPHIFSENVHTCQPNSERRDKATELIAHHLQQMAADNM